MIMNVSRSIPRRSAAAFTLAALVLKMSCDFVSRKCGTSPPMMTVEAYPETKSLKISKGFFLAALFKAVNWSIPRISTSLTMSLASLRIAGIKSTSESLLKLI